MLQSRLTALILSAVVLATMPSRLRAQDPAYVRLMPAPLEVMEKTTGKNAFDTEARRFATLWNLIAVMGVMRGPQGLSGTMSSGEQTLLSGYQNALARSQATALSGVAQSKLEGTTTRFTKEWNRYAKDRAFRQQMMTSLFSPELQVAYEKQMAGLSGATPDASARNDHTPERATSSGNAAEPSGTKSKRTGLREAFDQANTWQEFVSALPSTYRWLLYRSTWVALFGLAFGFGLLLAIQPLRYESSSPPRLFVAGRRYRLLHVAGTVRDVQRWTKFSVQRTHSTYTNLDGSTHTEANSNLVGRDHLQIMLRVASGRDIAIHFEDMEYPVAVGHHVFAMWALRGRRKAGPYWLFLNHELGRLNFMPALNDALRPSLKPILLLPPLLLAARVPWMFWIVPILAYWILVIVLGRISTSRFRALKLWSALDEAPSAEIGSS